jgi:hypothetical protein
MDLFFSILPCGLLKVGSGFQTTQNDSEIRIKKEVGFQ